VLLNQHFVAMQQIVAKYGGVVNKVDTYALGYRLMAIFGAPVAHENDPENAVAAALEMQAASQAFAELESPAGRFTLRQRTGVNTGYVFAGNLGSQLRQEYSVMGDEVNLAARLMGVAEQGQVLISQATARYVSNLFEWQERPAVSVKGKSQPVRNYLVSGRAERRAPAASSKGRFVGRQAELALARRLVDAAMQGQGAVLDLYGEAGVGKSSWWLSWPTTPAGRACSRCAARRSRTANPSLTCRGWGRCTPCSAWRQMPAWSSARRACCACWRRPSCWTGRRLLAACWAWRSKRTR
jgi:class 3 adenylate cyclase